MAISIVLEDELGNVERKIPDARGILSRILINGDIPSNTLCLRFINPYGNTVFNVLQMDMLKAELSAVPQLKEDPVLWRELETAIDEIKKEYHLYLKFIGD